jgi:hypothetical protein
VFCPLIVVAGLKLLVVECFYVDEAGNDPHLSKMQGMMLHEMLPLPCTETFLRSSGLMKVMTN